MDKKNNRSRFSEVSGSGFGLSKPGIIMVMLLLSVACTDQTQKKNDMNTSKPVIEYLSPEGMHKNPSYSQVVTVKGSVKTVYIGGQNSVNESGEVIGKGDLKAQAEQILKNVKAALKGGGATFDNVIKWNIYVVQGQPIQPAFEVFQKDLSAMPKPPLVTMAYVSGLANPDFLMEIEAVAVVGD